MTERRDTGDEPAGGAPWRRPGILVGRPFDELSPTERALLLTALCALEGRDPDELEAQLALLVRGGPARK